MKTLIFTVLSLLFISGNKLSAQENTYPEKYGKTLNLGAGIGYYGYVGHPIPVLHADFEFDIAKNLTIAPFITLFTYQRNYYYGNSKFENRNYYYRETVIPIGAKVSYYFDELLKANSKWDFYVGTSLGVALRTRVWENGYTGETNVDRHPSPLYADMHIGAEYHLNRPLGLFLDLSTGVSTFGLGIHF
jgi:hypothetical protein